MAKAEDRNNSISLVTNECHRSFQRLAAVVVNPDSVFISIRHTAEAAALDMNGNCQGEVFDGWFLNTVFRVISHATKIPFMPCHPQVTAHGVFTDRIYPQE